MSRILGGAKGRFCPVAGGGWSLCVSLPVGGRGVALCPVSITTGEDGRTVARSGSLRAKTTGPARPPIWPGLVGYIGDFWPCVIFGPVGPLFCPVAGFLRPCGDLSRLDLCGASGGLLWAVVGWVGIACGPAVSIWGEGRPLQLLPVCLSLTVPGFASCLPCLGLFRPFWGFICPGLVCWCGVVFLLLYRAKEKRPCVGSFLLGWCGGVSSTGISLAGLAWTRSRYAGRASPL